MLRLIGYGGVVILLFWISSACSNASFKAAEIELLQKMALLEGAFMEEPTQGGIRFNKLSELNQLLVAWEGEERDELVRILYGNWDNETITQSTFRGQKVALGHLCYEAMRLLVTYEAVDEEGDVDLTWKGHIQVDEGLKGLRQAKMAWSSVMRERKYVFL